MTVFFVRLAQIDLLTYLLTYLDSAVLLHANKRRKNVARKLYSIAHKTLPTFRNDKTFFQIKTSLLSALTSAVDCFACSIIYAFLTLNTRHCFTVADWPTGNREISRWAPASESFFGPPAVHADLFHWRWHSRSADRLTDTAFSAWVTTCAVWVRVSEDGDVSYSFTCQLPPIPESKLFLMRIKKAHCCFYDHNWHFINESRLYVTTLRYGVVESSFPFLTMRE